eukprot:1828494-Rhodomonas_salina.1
MALRAEWAKPGTDVGGRATRSGGSRCTPCAAARGRGFQVATDAREQWRGHGYKGGRGATTAGGPDCTPVAARYRPFGRSEPRGRSRSRRESREAEDGRGGASVAARERAVEHGGWHGSTAAEPLRNEVRARRERSDRA